MLYAQRIRPDQWELLKQVRLTALQEAPYAFSATYAGTTTRTDAEWQEFATRRATSLDDCSFFVWDDTTPVGMAAGYRDKDKRMQLISVWVAPDQRGSGAAVMVVEAVCEWAASVGADEIIAWVTAGNDRALRFYERHGFHQTGNRILYPPDPTIQEIETVRSLRLV